MKIEAKLGDLTKQEVDAIVNPANSYGVMGGGVAGIIKRVGGDEIEQEAINNAPIAVGTAVMTTAGSLPCKNVIHAPTMEKPAMASSLANIELATKAALGIANLNKVWGLAFPGMGTGTGGISYENAVKTMVKVIKNHNGVFPKQVLLVGIHDELVMEFNRAILK